MFIYNVTVNVEAGVAEDWLQWMKEKHIPDVLATGLFLGSSLLQVMVEEEQGFTYTVQYRVRDLETLRLYQEVYAAQLQAEHQARYGDKCVAFRTILRHEDDFQSP
jgi:hypothetical protein